MWPPPPPPAVVFECVSEGGGELYVFGGSFSSFSIHLWALPPLVFLWFRMGGGNLAGGRRICRTVVEKVGRKRGRWNSMFGVGVRHIDQSPFLCSFLSAFMSFSFA